MSRPNVSHAGAAGLGLSYAHTLPRKQLRPREGAQWGTIHGPDDWHEPPYDWDDLEEASRARGRQAQVTVAGGGRFLKAALRRESVPAVGGGKRGGVATFSRASRRRMQETFHRIDQGKVVGPPLFVSLTYPGKDPAYWVPFAWEHKRHLERFLKRFFRLAEACGCRECFVIWRLEPQKRGAPHYHLLIFNVPHLPHEIVARWWAECVGSGDPEHERAGTQVQACRTWSQAGSYLSKYLAKGFEGFIDEGHRAAYSGEEVALVERLWASPGRFWGVRNRKAVPVRLEQWTVTVGGYFRLRRIARNLAIAQTRGRRRYRMRMTGGFRSFMSYYDARGALALVGAWRL